VIHSDLRATKDGSDIRFLSALLATLNRSSKGRVIHWAMQTLP